MNDLIWINVCDTYRSSFKSNHYAKTQTQHFINYTLNGHNIHIMHSASVYCWLSSKMKREREKKSYNKNWKLKPELDVCIDAKICLW